MPFWSVDGKWVYFAAERPEGIWKIPANGGTAVRLTKQMGYSPKESADGTRVFYVRRKYEEGSPTDQIWSVAPDGGDERYLTALPTSAIWTPARGGIYFLDNDAASASRGGITFFDLSSHSVQRVAHVDPGAGFGGDIGISSDGRAILYSQREKRTADIMLVEGFR
jgi:hypothetical protein